jgi:hypothetical protein
MSRLWLSLEPQAQQVRLSLSTSMSGPVMRAVLPLPPVQPRAVPLFLESLADWFGQPLCAVLDADAEDVRRRPEFWTQCLGGLDEPRFRVEWVTLPRRQNGRDKFLTEVGTAGRARRLVRFAAAGLK